MLGGYEDQNDHVALRTDAIFKLLANCLPEDDDLSGLERLGPVFPADRRFRWRY